MKSTKKSKTGPKSGEFKSRGPFEAKSKVAKPSIRKSNRKPAENTNTASASGTPDVPKTPNKPKSTRPTSRSGNTPSAVGTLSLSKTPGSNQKSAENANIPTSFGLSRRPRSNRKSAENANIPTSLGLSKKPRSNRKSAEISKVPSIYGTPRARGKSAENANIPTNLNLSRRPRSNRKSAELAKTPSSYGTPRSRGKSAEMTRSASGTPGKTTGSRATSQSGNTTNLTKSRTRSGTPMTSGNGRTPSYTTETPGRTGESQELTPNWPRRRVIDSEEEEDSDQEKSDGITREIIGTKEAIDGGKRTLYFKTNKLKTIESFLCYIGCSFPNIRCTILPIAVLNFFMAFFSQTIKVINELWSFDKEKKFKFFKVFSKLEQIYGNNLFDKLHIGRSLRGKTPSMDLAIMLCALLSIALIGTRHKAIILVCIFSLPFWFLALSHVKGFYYMGLFAVQIIDQILAILLRVLAMESVPKYHRTFAFISIQISTVLAQGFSRFFILIPDIGSNMFFQIATVFTILLCCHSVLNIHDSLFNLLTIGDFNRLEGILHRYISLAKLKMQAATTVDNLAFETFESSDDILQIVVDSIKTYQIMYELIACSIVSAMCLNIYSYIDKEISESTKLGMFDKLMLSPVSFSVAIVLMTFFMFILPKCRLIPITIASLLVLPAWAITQIDISHTHNRIPCEGKGHSQVGDFYIFGAVITMGITDVIRLFLHVHLLEQVPSIVRFPALACFRTLEYILDGSIRDFMPSEGVNSSYGMHIFYLLPLGVWLLTPKTVFGLTVYFSEVRSIVEKKHKLQPAPVVV